jgi:hypothetical protein
LLPRRERRLRSARNALSVVLPGVLQMKLRYACSAASTIATFSCVLISLLVHAPTRRPAFHAVRIKQSGKSTPCSLYGVKLSLTLKEIALAATLRHCWVCSHPSGSVVIRRGRVRTLSCLICHRLRWANAEHSHTGKFCPIFNYAWMYICMGTAADIGQPQLWT